MKKMNLFLTHLISLTLLALLAITLWLVFVGRTFSENTKEKIQSLPALTYTLESGESGVISLPHAFSNLQPRTPITLTTQIPSLENQCLLIKTVYTPLRLYADNILIYECGQPGSYPDFLLDPPTIINIVPLPDKSTPQLLRFEFLSPSQRDLLTIPLIALGTDEALIAQLASENGFTFISSLLQITIGLVLLTASLLFLREPSLKLLLWIGLFSLATGIWSLGECDLTCILYPFPELLYLMAFLGLFTFSIPLLRCGILLLNLHDNRLPHFLLHTLEVSVIVALTLQLLGVCSLSRSMYFFHILIPLTLLLFAANVIWESIHFPNIQARRLVFPILILAASAVLERVNYQLRLTDNLSIFTQLGVLFFILSLGWIGGNFALKAVHATAEKNRLEYEMLLMERQLDVQRLQYETLMKTSGEIKKQHHDLRHQLTAIRQYNTMGDTAGLDAYLNELIEGIPVYREATLCENIAVNAVALYYLSAAEKQGIEVQIKLHIPAHCGSVLDSDLCVVVGNLFENAVEACEKMTTGKRFIKISSFIQHDFLAIIMDNSFDGIVKQKNTAFLSRKGGDHGTGLSSVEAVAQKYDGMATFEVHEQLFSSSVYIQMGQKSVSTHHA